MPSTARKARQLGRWCLLAGGTAIAIAAGAQSPTLTHEQATAAAVVAAGLPSFAELEAAGATIGTIRIANRDIFDTSDPAEDYTLFRWANQLHIQTRASVIRRHLLFAPGDRVSVRRIEEAERLLLARPYLYEVQFSPSAYRDGVVDIDVLTRDTWSLELGIRLSRSGGENESGFQIRERNLLGTGTSLSLGRSNDVDRSGNEFEIAHDNVLGTWTAVGFSHNTNSDGRSDAASIVRPFYELDARWAAGALASQYDRIDSIYNTGEIVSQYRHRQTRGEVFGGRSRGLVDGWVARYSIGLSYQDDAYAAEPGLAAPPQLPTDETLVGPFVRYQLIEDRYRKAVNRNLIGRPEFFALGLNATAQLGLAAQSLGSSLDALVYSGSISRGVEWDQGRSLFGSAGITGHYGNGQVHHQHLGGRTQYYHPQGARWLFYASAAADLLTNPDTNQLLMLGGDNGLRGYPLRYQGGTRRALFTAEERFYTDIYLWRLFRFGGAAFVDVGRAWGGDNTNTANPGWLADLGFGLRILSARSAFGTVLHLDLAFPLQTTPDIDKAQFLVTSKTSF